jgi:hypothetical protein
VGLLFWELGRCTKVCNAALNRRDHVQALLLECIYLDEQAARMQAVIRYVSFLFSDVCLLEFLLLVLLVRCHSFALLGSLAGHEYL